ncbi:hypothetical protein ACFFRR_006563 [Megaselia abdita]
MDVDLYFSAIISIIEILSIKHLMIYQHPGHYFENYPLIEQLSKMMIPKSLFAIVGNNVKQEFYRFPEETLPIGFMDLRSFDPAFEWMRGKYASSKTVIIVSIAKVDEPDLERLDSVLKYIYFKTILFFYDSYVLKFDKLRSFEIVSLHNMTKETFQARDYTYKMIYANEEIHILRFPLFFSYNHSKCSGEFCYFNYEFIRFLNKRLVNFNRTHRHGFNVIHLIQGQLSHFSDTPFPFPVSLNKMCLMVPIVNQITADRFIIAPFSLNTWLSILLGFILLIFVIKAILKKSIMKSVQTSLYFTTFLSTIPHLYKPTAKEVLVYVMFNIYGFTLTNNYAARLSTYLTSFVYGKQINSASDFADSSLKIMGDKIQRTIVDRALSSLVEVSDLEVMYKEAFGFNTKLAYNIFDYQWEFFKRSQERLAKKHFRFSEICIFDGAQISLLPLQTPPNLIEVMSYFTQKVLESGLLFIWRDFSYQEALRLGRFEYLKDKEHIREPLQLQYFKVGWIFLMVGLSLAFIAFAMENIRKVYFS